jgi:hypothetical protein
MHQSIEPSSPYVVNIRPIPGLLEMAVESSV